MCPLKCQKLQTPLWSKEEEEEKCSLHIFCFRKEIWALSSVSIMKLSLKDQLLESYSNYIFFLALEAITTAVVNCKTSACNNNYVNWLPPRTIVCQLFIVPPTNWLGRLWINLLKLRWWPTRLFCLGRIGLPGLIYCDRTWLIFLGVHIRLLTQWQTCSHLDCQIIFL